MVVVANADPVAPVASFKGHCGQRLYVARSVFPAVGLMTSLGVILLISTVETVQASPLTAEEGRVRFR